LEADLGNLRAALSWGAEHDAELMLRLAGALWRFWWVHPTEGRMWLKRAVMAGGSEAPAALRAKALDGWRCLGNPWGTGIFLGKLGDVAQARGVDARAAALYRESLDFWQSQGELVHDQETFWAMDRDAL